MDNPLLQCGFFCACSCLRCAKIFCHKYHKSRAVHLSGPACVWSGHSSGKISCRTPRMNMAFRLCEFYCEQSESSCLWVLCGRCHTETSSLKPQETEKYNWIVSSSFNQIKRGSITVKEFWNKKLAIYLKKQLRKLHLVNRNQMFWITILRKKNNEKK